MKVFRAAKSFLDYPGMNSKKGGQELPVLYLEVFTEGVRFKIG
jgi:hypothetical protein